MNADKERVDAQINVVETDEERSAAFALRTLVFVEEQRVLVEEELDTYDDMATHFLVRLGTTATDNPASVVGTARLVDLGDGVGKIGRVAILAQYRGRGLGAALMRAIEGHARVNGFRRLDLDAQCYAIPFYAKLGYAAQGEIFLDANIEHRHMTKVLRRDVFHEGSD